MREMDEREGPIAWSWMVARPVVITVVITDVEL